MIANAQPGGGRLARVENPQADGLHGLSLVVNQDVLRHAGAWGKQIMDFGQLDSRGGEKANGVPQDPGAGQGRDGDAVRARLEGSSRQVEANLIGTTFRRIAKHGGVAAAGRCLVFLDQPV